MLKSVRFFLVIYVCRYRYYIYICTYRASDIWNSQHMSIYCSKGCWLLVFAGLVGFEFHSVGDLALDVDLDVGWLLDAVAQRA